MAQAIVLPGSRNFPISIDPAVPQARLADDLSAEDFQRVKQHFGGRPVPSWGFTPTKAGGESAHWTALKRDDLALFTGEGGAFATARIAEKARSEAFARSMWGEIDDGRTWEYLIFLDSVARLAPRIPYVTLNAVLGYHPSYVYPGALLLSPDKTKALEAMLRERHALPELRPPVPTNEQRVDFAAADPRALFHDVASLDKPSGAQRRVEQHALRKLKLRGRSTAPCALCGSEFTEDLLVAAHVKRRADCTHEERLDFEHNVMLLCLFGCDALFERQYLVVRDGRIHEGTRKAAAGTARTKVTYLRGKSCAHWSEGARSYFAAHSQRGATSSESDGL